jgi:hypothetical protein
LKRYTSPTALFNLNSADQWRGISYDAANNSLWVTEKSPGDTIADYTLGGALISSFSTGNSNLNEALAYDPADGTLWLNTRFVGGIKLQQWSTAGALLGTLNFTTGLPSNTNVLGAEFEEPGSVVPEPISIVLLATVCGALLFPLRRKRVNAGPIT